MAGNVEAIETTDDLLDIKVRFESFPLSRHRTNQPITAGTAGARMRRLEMCDINRKGLASPGSCRGFAPPKVRNAHRRERATVRSTGVGNRQPSWTPCAGRYSVPARCSSGSSPWKRPPCSWGRTKGQPYNLFNRLDNPLCAVGQARQALPPH